MVSDDDSWRLPQLWATFLLLLLAVTFRLWIPVPIAPLTSVSLLPSVPLLPLATPLPTVIGWCPIVLLLVSLVLVTLFPRQLRAGWWIVSVSLLSAFLLDQHRLQPWAYQSAIYALVFASLDAAAARRCLVPFAISVYLYSGVGKLDYQFAHTVGQDLIEMATRPLGGLPNGLDGPTRAKIALALPIGELLVGLCLVFRRLRRCAGWAVIAMHLTLIALLGPWGLDHSLGVLTWNVLLIVQAWFLFVKPGGDVAQEAHQKSPALHPTQVPARRIRAAAVIAYGVVGTALVAPLFERSGYWDHWLSWALYSPHSSRVELQIHRSALGSLDPPMREFLEPDHDSDGWQKLSLSRWSLETLGVPIYPQARYQLGLAVEVARRHELGDTVRARIRGVSDRWTGRRSEQLLIGRAELESATNPFWLGR